jgi:hypothetical protein
MGVGSALRAWRPLLRSDGKLALTEAVWLKPDPPEPVRRCWAEYPAMAGIVANRKLVHACGYQLLGDFVLLDAAWWDDYYGPKEKRLAELLSRYAGDPVATAILGESREELEIRRQYSGYYGYLFLIARKN